MASYDISALSTYVDQQRLPLIGKAVLGGKTIKMATLQSGVKGTAALNLINTSIVFGNGAACGWNEAGSAALSQRNLVAGHFKVNMSVCDKSLLDYWAGYQVRVAAGQKSFPFEEDFTNNLAINISKELDRAIWNGDTSSSDTTLVRMNGIIKNLGSDAVAVTVATSDTYLTAVEKVVKAIPAAVAAKDDVVIFCAPEFLTAYKLALVNANLYHYKADEPSDEQLIPGTNIKLVGVVGLVGIKKLVALSLSNLFVGVDMMNDEEKFDVWYSQDNREFRVAVEFNAAANVAYPGEVVVGTYTTIA